MRAAGTRLLVAGFLGCQALGLVGVLVLGLTHGRAGAVSAALGTVVVVLYRVAGQVVTLRAADRPVAGQLATALASLLLRAGALTLLLVLWFNLPADVTARFAPVGLALGVLAGELGWLTALLVTGVRSRTPIYDSVYEKSSTEGVST